MKDHVKLRWSAFRSAFRCSRFYRLDYISFDVTTVFCPFVAALRMNSPSALICCGIIAVGLMKICSC